MPKIAVIAATAVIVATQIGCTWWLVRELRNQPDEIIANVGHQCFKRLEDTDRRTAFFAQTLQDTLGPCFDLK